LAYSPTVISELWMETALPGTATPGLNFIVAMTPFPGLMFMLVIAIPLFPEARV
jgi:hypothetical protein